MSLSLLKSDMISSAGRFFGVLVPVVVLSFPLRFLLVDNLSLPALVLLLGVEWVAAGLGAGADAAPGDGAGAGAALVGVCCGADFEGGCWGAAG